MNLSYLKLYPISKEDLEGIDVYFSQPIRLQHLLTSLNCRNREVDKEKDNNLKCTNITDTLKTKNDLIISLNHYPLLKNQHLCSLPNEFLLSNYIIQKKGEKFLSQKQTLEQISSSIFCNNFLEHFIVQSPAKYLTKSTKPVDKITKVEREISTYHQPPIKQNLVLFINRPIMKETFYIQKIVDKLNLYYIQKSLPELFLLSNLKILQNRSKLPY